jgi:hypothetical protein
MQIVNLRAIAILDPMHQLFDTALLLAGPQPPAKAKAEG